MQPIQLMTLVKNIQPFVNEEERGHRTNHELIDKIDNGAITRVKIVVYQQSARNHCEFTPGVSTEPFTVHMCGI